MKYQQLTEGQRYQISALLTQNISINSIAITIGCHRSSVYREIHRNGGKEIYCPLKAHQSCLAKRQQAVKYTIPEERVELIHLLIECDWSPEQISSVLTGSGRPVSHEWIYQHIAEDKALDGRLFLHLRQGRKRYRKGRRTLPKYI